MKNMRHLYTLLFSFITILGLAQKQSNNSISIPLTWINNTTSNFGTENYIHPTTQDKKIFFNPDTKQINYSNSYSSSQNGSDVIYTITSLNSEVINNNDLGNISINSIPNSFQIKINPYTARDKDYISINFNPIYKDGNVIKKIISLSINYQFKNNFSRNNSSTNSISNSILVTGDFLKIPIQKSGVYKLSKAYLNSIGFNTNSDPRNIKIYGNGGRMLPLSNNTAYPNDLEENSIKINGEQDGQFNDGDYILFYAEGVDTWNNESLTHVNLYSDYTYYYITNSSSTGKRISNYTEPIGSANTQFSTYNGYAYHEVDLFNPAKLGRRWYGENFDVNNTQDFNFDLLNYQINTPITLSNNYAAVSQTNTSFTTRVNGTSIGNTFIGAVNSSTLAFESQLNTTFSSPNTLNSINITYNNGGIPTSKGYLDYIILKYNAELKGGNKQYLFYNESAASLSGIGQYNFNNASSINEIWDITDIYNINSLSNTSSNFSFKFNLGSLKKFIALNFNDYFTPIVIPNARVANQNLKGTIFLNESGNFEDIDYLIICNSSHIAAANQLANFHKTNSNLKVKVVTLNSIYEEFGSGKQDIAAIRNFIKYVYNNASTISNRVKYVNLYGDASYDYKNRVANNNNIVPTFCALTPGFQSLYSTFISDDFFVMLDDNEGLLNGSEFGSDVAVGRMLFSNLGEAFNMNKKVVEYYDYKSYGNWRNKLTYYSDDPDRFNTSDYLLQFDLNQLANQVNNQIPTFNTKKIFTDAYQQIVTPGGPRYPQAKNDFINSTETGSLILNYYGHGNEEFFSGERIFEKADAQTLNNKHRYPLFITITCEFTRFDDPNRATGGEYMYWNNNGGAISLLATTRQIGQSSGININENIYENLFTYENNSYISISEALRRAKANNNITDNRVVFYIGDPALVLAIPKPNIVLTKINDEDINTTSLTLQALGQVTLEGEVHDLNNTLIPNYNGELEVQIFDKNINRNTLNNDNTGQILNFNTNGEVIFRGNASITNGRFTFSFIVPQDIQIPVGNGRVSFYAKSNNPILQDQTGVNTQIKVGGVNTNAPSDTKPPVVRLYMNDTNFVSGGITNNSPLFLAFLEDEHGINTSSGIGHDIVAILDGNVNNPYILNEYYQTELNDYTKGKINYPFRDLAPGLHTITFKAWDVYNNLITAEIQFVVVAESELQIEHVLNYPNPFVSYTEFWFNHNMPFEPLDVQIQIFTITGKIVKTINQTVITNGFLSREIKWDGKDDFGDRIGKGVYVYKLTVKSQSTGKKTEKIEKLVIL